MTTLRATERALLLRLLAPAPRIDPASPSLRSADWTALHEFAGVVLSPMLLHGIEAHRAVDEVPSQVIASLRENQRAVALQHMRQQAALRAACATLAGAAIPVMVLKGAALKHLAYPEPTLRPMTDLDLWVPPNQFHQAVDALALHGFHDPADGEASHSAAAPHDRVSPRLLEYRAERVNLEVHAHIRSLQGLPWADFQAAWDAGVQASLGGIDARVLGPEHLLAHLCLHLARANAFDSHLLHLVDIALVTQRWSERWDWSRLMHQWTEQRIATWMVLSLVLARDLLGAPVPPGLESRVPLPERWPSLRRLAMERLWDARRHRLPKALALVVRSRSLSERLRWLRERIVDYYWRPPDHAGLLVTARGAGRRLWHDLRVKLPKYFVEWRSGALRGPTLARAMALEENRAALELLVLESGDLGFVASSPPPPAPAPDRAIAAGPAAR